MPETTAEDAIIRTAGYRIALRPNGQPAIWLSPDGCKVPHAVALGVAKQDLIQRRQDRRTNG